MYLRRKILSPRISLYSESGSSSFYYSQVATLLIGECNTARQDAKVTGIGYRQMDRVKQVFGVVKVAFEEDPMQVIEGCKCFRLMFGKPVA